MKELLPFCLWVPVLWEGSAEGWGSHALGVLGLYQQRWVILGGVSGFMCMPSKELRSPELEQAQHLPPCHSKHHRGCTYGMAGSSPRLPTS